MAKIKNKIIDLDKIFEVNSLCKRCKNSCKQSAEVKIIRCPMFVQK